MTNARSRASGVNESAAATETKTEADVSTTSVPTDAAGVIDSSRISVPVSRRTVLTVALVMSAVNALSDLVKEVAEKSPEGKGLQIAADLFPLICAILKTHLTGSEGVKDAAHETRKSAEIADAIIQGLLNVAARLSTSVGGQFGQMENVVPPVTTMREVAKLLSASIKIAVDYLEDPHRNVSAWPRLLESTGIDLISLCKASTYAKPLQLILGLVASDVDSNEMGAMVDRVSPLIGSVLARIVRQMLFQDGDAKLTTNVTVVQNNKTQEEEKTNDAPLTQGDSTASESGIKSETELTLGNSVIGITQELIERLQIEEPFLSMLDLLCLVTELIDVLSSTNHSRSAIQSFLFKNQQKLEQIVTVIISSLLDQNTKAAVLDTVTTITSIGGLPPIVMEEVTRAFAGGAPFSVGVASINVAAVVGDLDLADFPSRLEDEKLALSDLLLLDGNQLKEMVPQLGPRLRLQTRLQQMNDVLKNKAAVSQSASTDPAGKQPKDVKEAVKSLVSLVNGLMKGDLQQLLAVCDRFGLVDRQKIELFMKVFTVTFSAIKGAPSFNAIQTMVSGQINDAAGNLNQAIMTRALQVTGPLGAVLNGPLQPGDRVGPAGVKGDSSSILHVFLTYDTKRVGVIDFDSFYGALQYMSLLVSRHQAQQVYDRETNGSEQMNSSQFSRAVDGLKSEITDMTLHSLGLSPGKLIGALLFLALILFLLFIFIFVGLAAFTDSTSFAAVINSLLPLAGAVGVTSQSSMDLDEILQKLKPALESALQKLKPTR